MKLRKVPVGHAFEYELGKAIKLLDIKEFSKALPCILFGLMGYKSLVNPVSKIEQYFLYMNEDLTTSKLQEVRSQAFGTVVHSPHNVVRYLVTSGVAMSGVIVTKLGDAILLDTTTYVEDLGYAANYIGLNEL